MLSCLGHPELFKTGLILFIFVSVSIWRLCALQHWIQAKVYSMKNYSMETQDRFYSLGRETRKSSLKRLDEINFIFDPNRVNLHVTAS